MPVPQGKSRLGAHGDIRIQLNEDDFIHIVSEHWVFCKNDEKKNCGSCGRSDYSRSLDRNSNDELFIKGGKSTKNDFVWIELLRSKGSLDTLARMSN